MGKQTAEQKLLKLIEETDAQETPSTGAPEGNDPEQLNEAQKVLSSVQGGGAGTLSFSPVLGKASNWAQNILTAIRSGEFGLGQINKVLSLVLMIFSIVFLMNFLNGADRVRTVMDPKRPHASCKAWGQVSSSMPKGWW